MTDYYSEQRPWGSFTVLFESPAGYKVKELRIKPGHRLSYQSHRRRSEHWYFVEGDATIILNDIAYSKKAGDSVDVGVGVKHRIANHGSADVVLIEVQRGDYFGEDDIVRFSDDYNRVS